jgi:O-antigen ligase
MIIKRVILFVLGRINIFSIIVLFAWISFFPEPIQEKYRFYSLCFISLAFLINFSKKRIYLFRSSDWPLWIFLLSISINVFFAQQRNTAFNTYLDLAIPLFCIFYLMKDDLFCGKNFNLLLKAICICSILVSLGGILESIFAYNPIYEHYIKNPFYERYISGVVRPMSTQFNPVVLGSYLLGCLPFNFILFKQSRRFFKLLGGLGIVLSIVVIILVFSRGVFLGLLTLIITYLLIQKKYRTLFIFFIALILFISLCSYLPYPVNRFGKSQLITENRGILSDYRFSRCATAWNIIRDHPFVGIGFQHFRIRFYEYYTSKSVVLNEFMIADNMYLTILAETGITGFAAFLIFISSLFLKGYKKLIKFKQDSRSRQQLALVLSVFLGLLVNAGAYEIFYWQNPYMFFCIIAGLIKAYDA